MFRLTPNPTFTCTAMLSRPDSDKPVAIDVTWKHKGTREVAEWRMSAGKPGPDGNARTDADLLAEVIAGWGAQVVGDGDKPEPYSRTALDRLLETFPAASIELFTCYVNRLTDARAKN